MNKNGIEHIVGECELTIAGLKSSAGQILEMGNELVAILKNGGTIYTAGNGGSAAEALHMAEELVGRFRTNRRPLPAVALAADCTALTCIGNDFGFSEVFSRQIHGLGKPGDALVLLSTSGNSENITKALEAATLRRMKTFCLLGRGGGLMAGKGDYELIVRSQSTGRVQEAHQLIMHMLLEIVEEAFEISGGSWKPEGLP